MLKIYTVTEEFVFHHGQDQERILNAIEHAIERGAVMTEPMPLENGETMSFTICNIVAIKKA